MSTAMIAITTSSSISVKPRAVVPRGKETAHLGPPGRSGPRSMVRVLLERARRSPSRGKSASTRT